MTVFTTRRGWRFGVETTDQGRARLLQWSHLRDEWAEVGVFDTRAEARKHARRL